MGDEVGPLHAEVEKQELGLPEVVNGTYQEFLERNPPLKEIKFDKPLGVILYQEYVKKTWGTFSVFNLIGMVDEESNKSYWLVGQAEPLSEPLRQPGRGITAVKVGKRKFSKKKLKKILKETLRDEPIQNRYSVIREHCGKLYTSSLFENMEKYLGANLDKYILNEKFKPEVVDYLVEGIEETLIG